MKSVLWNKLRESLISVSPVALLVLFLSFTPLVSLSASEIVGFLISALFMVVGIGLFGLGADMAMTPMGEQIGSGLTKSRNLRLLLSVAFLMGLFITVAEPDLSVLASQVSDVMNGTLLIVAVGAGVGLFLLLAVLRIVFRVELSGLLFYFYMILFMLSALAVVRGKTGFLPLSFDSGGVTTGPITVPFIMALGVGIASTIGGKHTSENSFGLIALCSVGPMIAVLLLGMTSSGEITYALPDYGMELSVSHIFGELLSTVADVGLALSLIVVFFLLLQFFFLKLPRKTLMRIAVGIGYTFVGLVLFLTAAAVGFMPVGFKLGTELAKETPTVLIVFAFVLGAAVVLAEPAVMVLNRQVEDITNGTVSKRSMTIALSVGVGLSIALSVLRILLDFNVLYYLVPGYLLSFGLSFFVPRLYTAIAFDSGGVASGPLTSTFILPFAIGACAVLQGESKILSDGFGIVAMVAMTPLITIQLLGFRAVVAKVLRDRIMMKKILDADDEQVIRFM